MKPLVEFINSDLISGLRQKCTARAFHGLSFETAMKFLLSDGLMPESDLPVQSFLELEDWVREQEEPNIQNISATDLKNKSGEVLEKVMKGYTLQILKHGRPVAEIRPYRG